MKKKVKAKKKFSKVVVKTTRPKIKKKKTIIISKPKKKNKKLTKKQKILRNYKKVLIGKIAFSLSILPIFYFVLFKIYLYLIKTPETLYGPEFKIVNGILEPIFIPAFIIIPLIVIASFVLIRLQVKKEMHWTVKAGLVLSVISFIIYVIYLYYIFFIIGYPSR